MKEMHRKARALLKGEKCFHGLNSLKCFFRAQIAKRVDGTHDEYRKECFSLSRK